MKESKFSPIPLLLTAMAFLAVVAASRASAEVNYQVGMVLDDGRALVYRGAAAGMTVGDTFEVVRGGRPIGAIRLVDVREMYSIAVILSQSASLAANDNLRPLAGAKETREVPPTEAPPLPWKEEVEKSVYISGGGETEKSVKRGEAKELEAPAEERERVEEKAEESPRVAKEEQEEPEEKAEKKERRKKRTEEEEKEEEREEVPEKKTEEKKEPAVGDVVTDKLLYYDRYRARAGMIRPRGNYYDPVMAADVDRRAALIYGLDWITVERPNVAMVMRFLYGEPRIDSGHGNYDGESRYTQIAVNFIKSYKSHYFDANHYFFGFGLAYQRMGANLRCASAAGCVNGVPHGAYNSSREDNAGLNLIWGYHFTAMNIELNYVVSDGDFMLTADYPLGQKEVYRLVEKKQ